MDRANRGRALADRGRDSRGSVSRTIRDAKIRDIRG